MKLARIGLAVAVLALGLPSIAASEDSWVRVAPADGSYTAYLPAAPEAFHSVSWTPLGRFVTSGYELKRTRDGCNLTATALPAVLRWLGGIDVVYTRSRSSFLAENEAQATASRAITRQGNPGHLLEWSSAEKRGHTEFFVLSEQLHIFNCFADRGTALNLADAFFARLTLRQAPSAQ